MQNRNGITHHTAAAAAAAAAEKGDTTQWTESMCCTESAQCLTHHTRAWFHLFFFSRPPNTLGRTDGV